MTQVDPDSPQARGGAAAVPLPGASSGPSGRGLGRARIVAEAIALIDAEGLRKLTMRRLGARLGVEAMTLYHHLPGREALLDAVVEAVIDELYGDPDVHLVGAGGWQDYLQRLAHGIRRIALAHPQVFPLVASRPTAAPWVRPPLRSLRWIESILATLLGQGFSDRAAVDAYRAFSSFLLGHLLLEVSAMGVDTGPVDEPEKAEAVASAPTEALEGYPHLVRLQQELSRDEFAAEFEESLENLVERLDELRRG